MDIKEELKVLETLPGVTFVGRPAGVGPRYNTPLTAKENFRRFIKGEGYMWTPCSADFVTVMPQELADVSSRDFVFDKNVPESMLHVGGKDFFGIDWEYIPTAGGSMVRPGNPLLVPDITEWKKTVKFPDFDEIDWEAIHERLADVVDGDRVVVTWCFNGLFERLISFMEFENAALALIDEDEQDYVHELFSALCDMYDQLFDKFHKYLKTDIVYFHDDWGSQRAPFFSPSVCREMLVPYLKRVCESAHKRGMYIDFHSCGKIEPLVPCMIEAGCDIWSGQPMNDRIMVLQKYGDKIKLNLAPPMRFAIPKNEEEAKELARKSQEDIDEFMATYGPYMKSIVVSAMQAGNPKLYETVYTATREAYANAG